ncbi:hypothetical protein ACVW1C_002615 [Bradyrhizobium sp. USDA 4011]
MENRHGLAVGCIVSQATGAAEREAALALLDSRHRAGRRITLGADKAYDVAQFLHDLRERSVTPHVAIDGHLSKTVVPHKTAVDARTTRHAGYEVSQRCRKRIEEVFGWIKNFASLEATRSGPGGRCLHAGLGGLQSGPAAQTSGRAGMSDRGRWRVVETSGLRHGRGRRLTVR